MNGGIHVKRPYEKPELEITQFQVEDITCNILSIQDQGGADWMIFEDLYLKN
jgi:hypothetical protein